MPRMPFIASLLAVALWPAAASADVIALAPEPAGVSVIAPGITYGALERPGPQTIHVVRVRPDNPLHRIEPVLTAGRPSARGALTDAVTSRLGSGASVGINGDFFNFASANPSGLLLIDGLLVSEPEPTRSALLLPGDGRILAARLALAGTWQPIATPPEPQPAAQAFAGVNRPSERGRETVIYTPIYGPTTPAAGSRGEAVIRLDDPTGLRVNADIGGVVVGRSGVGGATAIPPGHVVISGVGADGPLVLDNLPLGRRILVRPVVAGLPAGVLSGIGGGPLLVQDGIALAAAGEGFTGSQLTSRTTRTAVGQRADGTLLLVAIEGPVQGRVGMSVAEQAEVMRQLGAQTAVAMDGGGSALLTLGGNPVLDTGGERAITDALIVSYGGVQIPPLGLERISPNGDRVDDRLDARVQVPVRGRLTVALTPRRGRERVITSRLAGPTVRRVALDPARIGLRDGPYTLVARHAPADGSPATEQSRRLVVDRTLAALRTRAFAERRGRARLPRLDVRFRLSRPARVSVWIETSDGRRLRTLRSGRQTKAGEQLVRWDRRARGEVVSGSLRIGVEVRSSLGRTGLVARIYLAPPPAVPESSPPGEPTRPQA